MRRRYLITYDVADDKRRGALFELLRDVGDHAQFSVFFAELTAAELARVRAAAGRIVHHDLDQVLVVDLGRCDAPGVRDPLETGVEAIGKPFAAAARVRII